MSQERTIYEVAIIGGGFSGTLALANLIQQPNPPSSIAWFESGPELGRGVAYSTQDTSHLLNVRAVRMGAFADKPDDFYRWLHSPEGQPPARHMTGKASFAPEDYLPRALYGRYLSHIVLDALETATQKGIRVDIYPLQVEDVAHDDSLLITARGPAGEVSIAAQALVLATGNAPTATLGYSAERDPRYIQDIWKNGLNKQLAALPEDSEIVIIGTGLTMVDTVLSLETAGYKGHITALSRNGYLPIVHHHEPAYPAWEWATSPAKAPRTALGLLQGLRKEIRRAVTQGHGWRSVLDSIRPVTQTLWRQMDEAQKTRFTKRLSGFWNVHRHRMAPDIHHKIFALQQKKKLTIMGGRILTIDAGKEGLDIHFKNKRTGEQQNIQADYVVNCTGLGLGIAQNKESLLGRMHAKGLIHPGPLGMGVKLADSHCAHSSARGAIYPLGSLLVGELHESIAVPELREQAQAVSKAICSKITGT